MIGAFITILCMFIILTGLLISLLIETYKEKENKSTKILGWFSVILSFGLIIAFFLSFAYRVRNQAIIDYTKGKYKVNIDLRIDTLRTVTKEPDISVIYENYLRQHSRL